MNCKVYNHISNTWDVKTLPQLKPYEVLIETKAVGMNRADILQARGLYPPPQGYENILGLEAAGIIVKTGSEVPKNLLHKKVMTLLPAGAYATYLKTHYKLCIEIPENLTFTEAAAIPEAIYTSYLNLVFLAKVQKNENILIYGACGGIGTTLIQLVKLYEANPIAIVGNETKKQFIEQFTTNVFLRNDELQEILLQKFKDKINIVWDIVGDEQTAFLHQKLLAKYGRWLLIGLLGKNKTWNLSPVKIIEKNISIIGSTLRNRPQELKILLTTKIKNEIIPYYETGILKPVIHSVIKKDEINKGFELLLSNKVCGKIVILITD